MIERQDRQKIVDLLQLYMDEKITAFAFNDGLCELYHSKDHTAAWTVRQLWYYYDDIKDHKIHATKEVWDYFWRLRLLLESEAEIDIFSNRYWQAEQMISFILLGLFICIAYFAGWGWFLAVIWMIFGLAGIVLSKLNHNKNQIDIKTYPFAGFSEIKTVRNKIPCFSKSAYPAHLKTRRIRWRFLEIDLPLTKYFLMIVFGPFVLLRLSLPQKETYLSILPPE